MCVVEGVIHKKSLTEASLASSGWNEVIGNKKGLFLDYNTSGRLHTAAVATAAAMLIKKWGRRGQKNIEWALAFGGENWDHEVVVLHSKAPQKLYVGSMYVCGLNIVGLIRSTSLYTTTYSHITCRKKSTSYVNM